MRIILIFLVLFISKFGFSQGQPWVGNNAVWTFHFNYQDEFIGYSTGIFKVRKTGNVLRGPHLCDELLTFEHSDRIFPLDSAIIDTNYTYLSVTGDSVMYEQGGVFRVLYDFSAAVGDSTLYHVNALQDPSNNCNVSSNDSSYTTITTNYITSLGGAVCRAQGVDGGYPNYGYSLSGTFNERFGPFEFLETFLFPTKTTGCWTTEIDYIGFLCFSDDDLTYEHICDFSGIEKNDLPTIEVMPNPFSQFIYISELNDSQKTITVWLSDNLGTILFKGTATELEDFNAENLSAGSYRLLITLEDGHSLIKQLVKL